MEQLESILRAEEASRRVIGHAHAHARDLLREARAEAELIAVEADRATAEQADAIRTKVRREAEIAVHGIDREAEAELDRVVRQSESRFEDAVQAVVDALAG